MRYRIRNVLFIIAVVTTSLLVGCDRKTGGGGTSSRGPEAAPTAESEPTAGPVTVNGKTLDAKMSDAEMLEVFDMKHSEATSKRAQGPDGYGTTYTQGEQKVSITRSLVTGIYVMASGPVKGDWRLGKTPEK